jgi:hypothetical protein
MTIKYTKKNQFTKIELKISSSKQILFICLVFFGKTAYYFSCCPHIGEPGWRSFCFFVYVHHKITMTFKITRTETSSLTAQDLVLHFLNGKIYSFSWWDFVEITLLAFCQSVISNNLKQNDTNQISQQAISNLFVLLNCLSWCFSRIHITFGLSVFWNCWCFQWGNSCAVQGTTHWGIPDFCII